MSEGYGAGGQPLGVWLMRGVVALVIAAVGITAVAIRGCQQGPFGRAQVVALNPQQEAKLGLEAYQEVLTKSRLIESGPIVKAVDEVFVNLREAAEKEAFLRATQLPRQKMEWECKVVQSKEVNAFCLPGGKIVVYTAILPICETNAGLATVMGHEIAHALAHHGAERMAQQEMAQIAVGAANTSMSDMSAEQRQRLLAVLNAGAKFGILRYSRKHESEADHIGLLMMATAGYNPEEAIKFWEHMEKRAGGGHTPEFLSTHPSHQTRIQDLMGWMPQAKALYEAAGERETKLLPLR